MMISEVVLILNVEYSKWPKISNTSFRTFLINVCFYAVVSRNT